ncbi:MAG TPA: hypothetical protein VGO60_18935 [Iamia sp.]|jgi:hypothetical protein|nr:hypothetical protein [Iamia sp.]
MGASVYEAVAAEYYDAALHPTCANFRDLTITLFRAWADELQAPVVELGAGRSSLPDLGRTAPERAVLVDSSPAMLAGNDPAALRMVGDARHLPLRTGVVGSVVAAMADPFNDSALWAECARVGRPGAVVLFSTPSHGWARRYRASVGDPVDRARFATAAGSVLTPSYVLTVDEQVALMEAHGLRVTDVEAAGTVALPTGTPVSPKLAELLSTGEPAVTAFRAEVR